jgi:hypothetical protein
LVEQYRRRRAAVGATYDDGDGVLAFLQGSQVARADIAQGAGAREEGGIASLQEIQCSVGCDRAVMVAALLGGRHLDAGLDQRLMHPCGFATFTPLEPTHPAHHHD